MTTLPRAARLRSPALIPFLAAFAFVAFAVSAAAVPVTFTYRPGPDDDITAVSVRGAFNDWGEASMTRQDDSSWTVTIDLEPGEHPYKFFINGQWPPDMEEGPAGGPIDDEAEGYEDDGHSGQNAIRVVAGEGGAGEGEVAEERTWPPAPALAAGHARVHYHRPDRRYAGWGLHAWEDVVSGPTWTAALMPSGQDPFGVYWDVAMNDGWAKMGFIVHKGDAKDPGADQFLMKDDHGSEVWIVSGDEKIHPSKPDVSGLAFGDLRQRKAHWVDGQTIAWPVRPREGSVVRLHFAPDGGLALGKDGVSGGESFELVAAAGLPDAVQAKFPHLRRIRAFTLPADAAGRAPELLTGQLAVSVSDGEDRLQDATGLQLPGVLDDLFATDAPLGVHWDAGVPTLSVWAPTARSVKLHLFDAPGRPRPSRTLPMERRDGVWSLRGEANWKHWRYLYEVEVYLPSEGAVKGSIATDPYSRGLSANGGRSQIVDLDDPALKPAGWDTLEKPELAAIEDIVLYELHLRDFSAADETVPEKLRGTYLAFTQESDGTRHLRELAEAGLTHVHLLPVFDIASVDENRRTWRSAEGLAGYAPDSERPQAAVVAVQEEDAFNWGYDPHHYGVPEGSYATSPNGTARIVEFRQMVQAHTELGLRTVMDVVYNHTHASGQNRFSVLDKIVPGYYHRLNNAGSVETSTCCQNTASEHAMMERLIVDDLVHWARNYKIDGFRFDLMGHHLRANLEKARDALAALTLEADGVDGAKIYLYGEGWDFGEVAGGKRGVNATQPNMAGTGIGTFNDRIRDAVRGGSAFSDRREQGFATGRFTDPSGYNRADSDSRELLLDAADRIRFGMAGNLGSYRLEDHIGKATTGNSYHDVGYASAPRETINYVSAHDNETLWDKIAFAAPAATTTEDRARMQMLGVGVVALGQGIPFFHAGVELLRSKSLDADSYNSGDWFNALDWSYSANGFGKGLPVATKNRDRWNVMRPILTNPQAKPDGASIRHAAAIFRDFLRIRRSSPLFRLASASDVQDKVHFHNTGPDQRPGLIVMSIADPGKGVDPEHEEIVVVINATPDSQTFGGGKWEGRTFRLHPVQAEGADDRVKTSRFDGGEFRVPARTAAVFVRPLP